MELNKRLDIFIAALIGVAFLIQFLRLPNWLMTFVADIGISFVLSGIVYMLLSAAGVEFLEEIQIGFVSAMTVAVFVIKQILF